MDVRSLLNGQEATHRAHRGANIAVGGAGRRSTTPPPSSAAAPAPNLPPPSSPPAAASSKPPPALPPLQLPPRTRPQLHRQQHLDRLHHHHRHHPQSQSPDTPPLSRSGSADSTSFPSSSSPTTPRFALDLAAAAAHQRGPRKSWSSAMTPQIPQTPSLFTSAPTDQPAGMDAYPISPELTSPGHGVAFFKPGFPPAPFDQQQLPPQPQPHPQQPPPPPQSYSTAGLPKVPQKKNSYPCPVAKQFGCTDYFTTSGHAARHAKKHTGKKDAICPECSKAFTRKDNMEQHRRTHSGARAQGKSASTSTSTEESRAKKAKVHHKKPKPAPIATMASDAPPSMEMATLDPALRDGSMSVGQFDDINGGLPYPSPMPAMQTPLHMGLGQYPDPMRHGQQWGSFGSPRSSISTSISNNGFELQSPSLAPALDALALAASRQ